MKRLNYIYLLYLLICLIPVGCKNETGTSTELLPISDYEAIPINGGAIIEYSLPKDPNILCVTAEYVRNEGKHQTRSSYHNNSITIEGFKTEDEVEVTLYTEDYNGNFSDPVTVRFTPLEAYVDLTKESLEFMTSFGGIIMQWQNKSNSELRIHLMAFVDGELVGEDIHFSTLDNEERTYRGFEDVETVFAILIADKWKNISDTVYYTTTPLFEIEVPKPWGDMRFYVPGDNLTQYGPTHAFPKLFDGLVGGGSLGYLNVKGSEGNSFTLDLYEPFILSRLKFWPSLRDNSVVDVYGNVNLCEFELWGSLELDLTKPASYWEDNVDPTDTFKEDWVYIGYFERKRLDLIGATNAEIWQHGEEGDEFELPVGLAPVRYIRFFARASKDAAPPPNNYWQLGELSFYGTNKFE